MQQRKLNIKEAIKMSFLTISWLAIIVWNLITLMNGTRQMAKNHVHSRNRHCSGQCPHCKKRR